MARKKAANGNATAQADGVADKGVSNSGDVKSAGVATSSASSSRIDMLAAGARTERDVIKVNNMNLSDLKNACDDVVKRMMSQPDLFVTNHTHTDVKLALGWSSVFVAAGTALYGWKVEFEKAKPLVWVGVILYVVLTTASTLYAYFIEKDTVYVGRRKTLAKRIETEHITVAARTVPAAKGAPPRYGVTLAYVRSSNSGKSLLGRGSGGGECGYDAFFDEAGTMDQMQFERWFGALVERVMEGSTNTSTSAGTGSG